MPILPLIDLLVVVGTVLLGTGFLLKVVNIATFYNPAILGFSSTDFVLMTGICWGFALILAARTWVRLNEPKLIELRRQQRKEEARRQAQQYDMSIGEARPVEPAPAVRGSGEGS